jgi:hypothetical protein
MAVTFGYRTDLGLVRRQVGESDLAAAERELGARLPNDFRAFVRTYDGPTPSPGWFPVVSGEKITWFGPILHFLSTAGPAVKRLGPRSCCLETLTNGSREMEGLPAHFVVIAQLATQSSTLLLSTAATDYGAVYAWRVRAMRFSLEQITRVAESFTELLGMLREPAPEAAAQFHASVLAHQSGSGHRPGPEEYGGPEARSWLGQNRNPAPLAANHFGTAAAAQRFVEELYTAGATRVIIAETNIQPEDDLGPYADAVVVFLPADRAAREAVCRRCERELEEPEPIDDADANPVFLWWD